MNDLKNPKNILTLLSTELMLLLIVLTLRMTRLLI